MTSPSKRGFTLPPWGTPKKPKEPLPIRVIVTERFQDVPEGARGDLRKMVGDYGWVRMDEWVELGRYRRASGRQTVKVHLAYLRKLRVLEQLAECADDPYR